MRIVTPLPANTCAIRCLAARWGVSVNTVYSWVRRKLLKARRTKPGARRLCVTLAERDRFESTYAAELKSHGFVRPENAS